MKPLRALDVARYLVYDTAKTGDCITNLKLQKVLYYAQGWHLALYDESLYSDQLQAWVRGPVQPGVYGYYRYEQNAGRQAWEPLVPPDDDDVPKLPKRAREHLGEIWEVFGKFTVHELEDMTHAEPPWQNARIDVPPDERSNNVISLDDMRDYFKSLVE